MKKLKSSEVNEKSSIMYGLKKIVGETIKDICFGEDGNIVILTESDIVYELHHEYGLEEDNTGYYYAS